MPRREATAAEIRWLETYASTAQYKTDSVAFRALLMSLPLLGDCSDIFMRQLATMEPYVWVVFEKHVVKDHPAWALPAAKVAEVKLCATRACQDAAAVWSALDGRAGGLPSINR